MVNIISRNSWGARAPKNRQTVSWAARQEVTLHYSTGSTSQTPRQIQDFHMGPSRGWADIGYNFLVDKDGKVYEGRGWLVVGAHAAPRNTQGIGVCYIGSDGMTDAAKRAVVALYDEACKRAGRTLSRRGHRDINSTSCPGSGNHSWWKSSGFRSVGSGSAPAPKPPKPGTKAPRFPLPRGHYFGPRSGPVYSVSGYYSHRDDLRRWQRRMRDRGWTISVDGLYGPQTKLVAETFQREKNLGVDGLIGAQTWSAAWTAPIT